MTKRMTEDSETPAAPLLSKEECWFQMLLRITQQEVKTKTSQLRKPNDTLGSMTSDLQVLDVAVNKPPQNNYNACSGEQLLSGNCLLTPATNR